mmetsp:Transcript_83578/g.259646  ORF Transcript_83578/g.259646 Transcript_83578/m.259646 type:complete len:326 (-) Transcript_83578:25-1002(-)
MWCVVALASLSLARAGLPHGFPAVDMNGVSGKTRMPLFGIGTWQYNDTVAKVAVEAAFKLGYRHVDTAFDYENLVGVGQALKASGIPRQDYFVTSKIPGGLNASAATQALQQSLEQLGLDSVDLMLLHFPAGMNPSSTPSGPAQRQESWRALEAWAKSGKAGAVGVSHYCERQLKDILEIKTLPIAVNQVQYHVGMGSSGALVTDDKAFAQKEGILYESFSPLCGPCDPPANTELIHGELVKQIGEAHGKTGAQVSLRWLVQQGIPVIPKSSDPAHIKQNMEIFDFELTDDEMAKLTAATSPAVGGGPSPASSGDCEVKTGEFLV